jgi:hypothetical protein
MALLLRFSRIAGSLGYGAAVPSSSASLCTVIVLDAMRRYSQSNHTATELTDGSWTWTWTRSSVMSVGSAAGSMEGKLDAGGGTIKHHASTWALSSGPFLLVHCGLCEVSDC